MARFYSLFPSSPLPVEVNTDVSSHVLRTNTEHFLRLHSLRVGPLGDDVVQHSLHQVPGHLVENHELPHAVQHLVVLGGGECHVVYDGRHVPEDGGVQQGRHDHHADGEGLLTVRLRRHVPEADGGHAGHCEVQGSHVHGAQTRASLNL